MKYRSFGKLDWQVSALGFGCMRFPKVNAGQDNESINEPKAIEMLRLAIDRGVNYIDTAYPYHKEESEILVGKALQDGYRQKVKLATKLPCWLINKQEDFNHYLHIQLKKLKTDKIDFYLLHALNRENWEKMKRLNVFGWVKTMIKDGKINYIGFSFHDNLKLFKEIVDFYDWSFCQIQYNYLNENTQAGREGLKYAAKNGLAVIVMEPLLGGFLASPKGKAKSMLKKYKKDSVNLALQWLWDQPEISTVLSGMSSIDQVKDNLVSADQSAVNSLSQEDASLIKKLQEIYFNQNPVPCTSCGYCLPCPQGVEIPLNFDLYNQATSYKKLFDLNKNIYHNQQKNKTAANCVGCRVCENKCPQKIEISQLMPKIKRFFADER